MASFYIEMGQGVMAQSWFEDKSGIAPSWLQEMHERGEARVTVRTSDLYTCAFIGGYNENTGWAGAFHYPAEELSDLSIGETLQRRFPRKFRGSILQSDWSERKWSTASAYLNCATKTTDGMLSWIQTLRPTACVLLEGPESGVQDMNRLETFLAGHGRVNVDRRKARARDVAMMSTRGNLLQVDDEVNFSDRTGFVIRMDVQKLSAGQHATGAGEKFILQGHNVEALKLPSLRS